MRTLDIEVIAAQEQEKTGRTGKPYEVLEVTYRSYYQGKPKTDGKLLLKFNTPTEVWDALKGSKSGEAFTVEIEKNEKGFLDWVGIATQTAAINKEEPSQVAETKNRYAEADDRRQQLIVRQSSLDKAVNVSIAIGDLDPTAIKTLAEDFEGWVNR